MVHASIHFLLEDKVARSPHRAPFGSFELSDEINVQAVNDFIQFVIDSLKKRGVQSVNIKMPPAAYTSFSSLLNVLLLANNFRIDYAEAGTIIPVADQPFEERIESSERYILNRCRKNNFTSKKLSIDRLEEVYTFIHQHLTVKGYSLSMTFSELQKTIQTFPDNFFLFVIEDSDKIIAASISVQVTEQVLYNFYVAHDAAYNQFSPVVMIIESLYIFCQEKDIHALDLGTSMVQQQINFTLLDFKLRLGAVVTEKLTFVKNLT